MSATYLLIERRGYYLESMNYKETRPESLEQPKAQEFLESYQKRQSDLGYASYTEIARALDVSAQQVMQHVKFLHIHSREWRIRFSHNRNNENVFFKLIPNV